MTCKCKHEFCYVCLMPHRGHNSAFCTERWELGKTGKVRHSVRAQSLGDSVNAQVETLDYILNDTERRDWAQLVDRAEALLHAPTTFQRRRRRRRCCNAVCDRIGNAAQWLEVRVRRSFYQGLHAIGAVARVLFDVLRGRLVVRVLVKLLRWMGRSLYWPVRVLWCCVGFACGLVYVCLRAVSQFFSSCCSKRQQRGRRHRQRERQSDHDSKRFVMVNDNESWFPIRARVS
ncbi:MAG: hypothetical protein MHM6MM_004514 [Cercozoa sp. M6MM]